VAGKGGIVAETLGGRPCSHGPMGVGHQKESSPPSDPAAGSGPFVDSGKFTDDRTAAVLT
jgi:hypothetical protein